MKKIYFIVPIVGAIIFFFFYSAVKDDIKVQEETAKKKKVEEQAERVRMDVENRKKAFQIALDEANRRIAEIEAKRKEEARKLEETEAAKDARDLAFRERERQYKRLMELSDSRLVANEQLARVKELLELQRIQASYLEKTTKEVVDNKMNFERALNKIKAVEDAVEAANAANKAAKRG